MHQTMAVRTNWYLQTVMSTVSLWYSVVPFDGSTLAFADCTLTYRRFTRHAGVQVKYNAYSLSIRANMLIK